MEAGTSFYVPWIKVVHAEDRILVEILGSEAVEGPGVRQCAQRVMRGQGYSVVNRINLSGCYLGGIRPAKLVHD